MTKNNEQSSPPSIEVMLTKFVHVYQHLTKDNLSMLAQIYHQQIEFEDPAHNIKGYPALHAYFVSLYANLTHCKFNIHQIVHKHNVAFLSWTMELSHPRLAFGAMRTISGCTELHFEEGLIRYHRDYFDLGAMLYEGLPVIGSIVRWLKKQLGNKNEGATCNRKTY